MTEPTPTTATSGTAGHTKRRFLGRLLLLFSALFFLLAAQEGCYQNAQRIRGTVVEKGYKRGTSAVGRAGTGSKSVHWVRYRFTTPEGEVKQHVDNEVLPKPWSELKEGGPVDIEYMPKLADSRVAGQKASSTTYAAIAMGLLAAGILTLRSARRAG